MSSESTIRNIGGRDVIIHPAKGHEPGHARLGPSSASRWLSCPASIRLSEQAPERPTGNAAAAGTVIHAAMEAALRGERPGFTDDDILELEALGFGLAYAQDILDRALAAVEALIERFDIAEMWLEERVWPLPGRDDLWGTSDIIGISRDRQILLVADLKTGRGRVSVDHNDQALLYGLGARRVFDEPPPQTVLAIIQPPTSRSGLSVFECDGELMAEFEAYVMTQLRLVDDADSSPQPGPGCIFCPAKPLCPATQL